MVSPFLILFIYLYYHRNVFSRKRQTTQRCESTGREICVSTAAMAVAADGILPLTVQSARLRPPLMVQFTCNMEEAVNTLRIYTAHVTLKESVRNFAKAPCALDSGSGDVLVTDPLLTPTPAGTQCPGFTLKKYLHRLKREDLQSFFVVDGN